MSDKQLKPGGSLPQRRKPTLRHRINLKANNSLHTILTVQCKLYRHPHSAKHYNDGKTLVRCPCGTIHFYERTFRV